MKASLKALAARFRPAKNTPAPAVSQTPAPAVTAMEAKDDTTAYDGAVAETLINGLCDQLESMQAKVRSLTTELVKANATITHLSRQPKNKYWGARAGKGK